MGKCAVQTDVGPDEGEGDGTHVIVKKVRIVADGTDIGLILGQSKICNWAYNNLLGTLKSEYERFCELSHVLDFACALDGEADELLRERLDLFMRLFSRYGIRDQLTELKEEHPFLRSVHSSPLKNAALRLSGAFVEWRKRRGEGYGFPGFRSWAKDFFSLEYDEKKGWNAQGRTLRLSFGEIAVRDADLSPEQMRALERKRKDDPSAVHRKRVGVTVGLAEPAPTDATRIEVVREGEDLFCVFTRKVAAKAKPTGKALTFAYLDPNHKNLFYGLTDGGEAFEFANREGLREQTIRIDRLKSKRDRAVRRRELVTYTREDGSEHRHWRPSNAWYRRNRALRREERRCRDQNKTFVYSALHRVFDGNDAVGLGNYAPEAKDHNLGRDGKARRKANRAINNRSLLGTVQRLLPHVARKRGKAGYVLDETGTTRTCHRCGHTVGGGISPGIRSWVCPCCHSAHIRDENACQNGLGRTAALLGGDGLPGNPKCDARASADDRHGPFRGVKVVSRCDWSFIPSGVCRIVVKPLERVAKLLASAKWVGQEKTGTSRNSGVDDVSPVVNLCQPVAHMPIAGFVCS